MRLLFVFAALLHAVAYGQEPPAVDATQQLSPDQAAIMEAAKSFEAAFNAKNASDLAAHFTEGAEVTTSSETLSGRKAIEADYANLFEGEAPTLQLVDIAVDVIAPSVAIETGIAVVSSGDESQAIPYRAVHVKSTNGWKLDRIQDEQPLEAKPSNYDKLASLEWMVGSWVLESESTTTTVTCRWTSNQNFLMQSYSVIGAEGSELEGTQVIGWDPIRNRIRSWMFDSDGGFGSGAWSREGDSWRVLTLQVVPEGQEASSTNIYKLIDETTFEFSSIGRQVGGQLLKNISAARFIRQ